MEKETYFKVYTDKQAAKGVTRNQVSQSIKVDNEKGEVFFTGSHSPLNETAEKALFDTLNNGFGEAHQLREDGWSVDENVSEDEARRKILSVLAPKRGPQNR